MGFAPQAPTSGTSCRRDATGGLQQAGHHAVPTGIQPIVQCHARRPTAFAYGAVCRSTGAEEAPEGDFAFVALSPAPPASGGQTAAASEEPTRIPSAFRRKTKAAPESVSPLGQGPPFGPAASSAPPPSTSPTHPFSFIQPRCVLTRLVRSLWAESKPRLGPDKARIQPVEFARSPPHMRRTHHSRPEWIPRVYPHPHRWSQRTTEIVLLWGFVAWCVLGVLTFVWHRRGFGVKGQHDCG